MFDNASNFIPLPFVLFASFVVSSYENFLPGRRRSGACSRSAVSVAAGRFRQRHMMDSPMRGLSPLFNAPMLAHTIKFSLSPAKGGLRQIRNEHKIQKI